MWFYAGVLHQYFYGMWVSSRIYLAFIDREIPTNKADPEVLENVAYASDPILYLAEVLFLICAVLFYFAVSHGLFPVMRWMRYLPPVIYMPIFPLFAVIEPEIGHHLLATTMNLAHIFFFTTFYVALRFYGDPMDSEEGRAELAADEATMAEVDRQEAIATAMEQQAAEEIVQEQATGSAVMTGSAVALNPVVSAKADDEAVQPPTPADASVQDSPTGEISTKGGVEFANV